jgi:putative transcription factor
MREARLLNCDICGREITNQAYKIMVEGAKMLVCGRCQRLGKPYVEDPAFNRTPPKGTFGPRVVQRRAPELLRGMDETDIVEDCADRVRRQRMKLGLSQDQLAKSVKEKLSVIQKIEIGKMVPNTRLCRSLEHELKIKLLVPHKEIVDVPKTAAPTEVTLGDIIKVKGSGTLNVEG